MQILNKLDTRLKRLEILEKPLPLQGAAFPTENLYQDRPFFRIDRGLTYYYDLANTRWQSELFIVPVIQRAAQPFAQSTQNYEAILPAPYTYGGTLLESIHWKMIPLTVAQSAVNYYTLTASKITAIGAATALTLTGTIDTKLIPLTTWYGYTATVGALLSATTDHVELATTLSGNPGGYLFYATLAVRFVN